LLLNFGVADGHGRFVARILRALADELPVTL
jgi:hypothetical protein